MAKKVVATNPTAKHNYSIEKTLEAGIVLTGTEIKSIRNGKINMKDSLVSLKDKQLMSAYVDVLIDDYPKNLEDIVDDYGNSLKANYKKIIFDYDEMYEGKINSVGI